MNEDFDYFDFYFRKRGNEMGGETTNFAGSLYLAFLAYTGGDCKGLRDDEAYLCRVCHGPEDWESIYPELFNRDDAEARFFRLEEDGRWHLEWACDQFNLAKNRVLANRKNGGKGGREKQRRVLAARGAINPPPPPRTFNRSQPASDATSDPSSDATTDATSDAGS